MKRTRGSDNDSSDEDVSKKVPKSEVTKPEKKPFTFINFKKELTNAVSQAVKIKLDDTIFWPFVYNFERRKPAEKKDTDKQKSCGGVSFQINLTVDDIKKHLCAKTCKSISKQDMQRFIVLVKVYADFKQKQKFNKLLKLRIMQRELPVAAYEEEIINSVKSEKVVLIAGDTGCGKSTQVPQYLLKAGFNKIACTQPRRIACISLAKRLAYETLSENTHKIGYQIRFERNKNPDTNILFITEGLLLRQVSSDFQLSNYDIVVLDEIHERHLSGDFLLGVLKCLLHKKDDFKLVLMSATINIKLFADYFGGNAKVVQVPGRLYPVELFYRPRVDIVDIEAFKSGKKSKQKTARIDPQPYLQIISHIDAKYPPSDKGDVLIFLSGISDITTIVDAFNEYNLKQKSWIVLPLHSSLSLAEQDKVFDYPPDGVRKCIVSTNIAETSITIDGIRFVVDSGKVKEMCYDASQKLQILKEFWVSAASAEQRKGRAGRTGPGICFRMYSEKEYSSFAPYSTPEIQRVSLDSVLLQMISMGLPNCRKFPFLESPEQSSLENSISSLKQQSALTSQEKLTSLGRALSNLPVDIVLGKMLILGSIFQQTGTVIPLAASLGVQSPFTNRAYRDFECERAWKEHESDQGDPLTLLNVLREWLSMKKRGDDSRQWCYRRGIEEQRLYEIIKLSSQFKDLLKDSKLLELKKESSIRKFDRSLRHGEMKLLKSLKRLYAQKSSRSRRILKLNVWGSNEGEEQEEIDIKDVEFRLSNDRGKVGDWLDCLHVRSHRSVAMIKIFYCWGLYPQFAMKDEFNDGKSVVEQLYHTKDKAYVFMHPNSFFGNNPDVLKINDSDVFETDPSIKYLSKLQFSPNHQILCYLNMLETNKTYLVQSLRMPALQTFLFYAQTIDTNSDLSRIICDDWVLFEMSNPYMMETLLLQLVKLRKRFDKLINNKLQTPLEGDNNQISQRKIEDLMEDIIIFQNTNIVYAMKRLLPADLKTLFVSPGVNISVHENPFDGEFNMEPNERKGGCRMTEYLTFNSITPGDRDTDIFKCARCNEKLILSCIERLCHRNNCKSKPVVVPVPQKSYSYFCDICKRGFNFNSIEILKHKKQHLSENGQISCSAEF